MKVKLYGITHSPTGDPIVRVPRVCKVQIGSAKGPDIQVAIGKTGNWLVWANTTDKANKGPHRIYEGPEKEAARWWYDRALTKGTMKPPAGSELKEIPIPGGRVVERRFPSKLAYFTFGKMKADGTYEPDWDSIEAHGSYPTELDIVFTDDEGFQAAYQMWTASELKCSGDGLVASRVVSLYTNEEEQAAAAAASKEGKRHYTVSKCRLGGCAYAIAPDGKPAPCKPHGRLQFQLIKNIRLGGVAQFDTTSIRSVSQLFSCVHQFMSFTGNGDPERGFLAGIPLKMVLRPFKVAPAGQPAGTAYSVSLEFRAESVEALKSRIVEAGSQFRQVMIANPKESAPAPQHRMIESGAPPISQASAIEAAAMVGEFYEEEAGGEESKPASDSSQVATATDARAAALSTRLQAARGGPQTPAQMAQQGTLPSEPRRNRVVDEIEPEPIPQSEPLTAEEVSDWVDGIGDPEPPADEAASTGTLFDNAPPATDAATTDAPAERRKGGRK